MPLFYFRLCDLILPPGFLSPGLSSQPGYPRAALEDTESINVYTRLQNTFCCSVVFRRIEHFFKMLFPCLVLGNSIEPLAIWHQEKSSIQILPWFIFLPFSTVFGSYMFTQQPVGKYVQFFVLDD